MESHSQGGSSGTAPLPRFWDPIKNAWMPVSLPSENPGEPRVRVQRPPWTLEVVDSRDITPGMRRITFSGASLATFQHEAAADFTLFIPSGGDQEPARRHYTARSFDPSTQRLDIDFAMHGEGPAVRWAATARPGMTLEVTGPVVRHELAGDAGWYLFAGDETAIPAIAGLLEDLVTTNPVRVFLEVKSPEEKLELEAPPSTDINWLFRGDLPAEESTLLHDAIQKDDLPPGRGEVFLAGETARMRDVRRMLLESGVDREQIFAMGYWRPGRFGGDETIRD